ncbi:MAG: tryptophan 7-halogenase, partial [Woeseiaceae bacterium]
SQGFIEPLEATALNIVCSTVDDFIATVEERGLSGRGRATFNDRTNDKFERIRDYIVAHYLLNSRQDTDYWRQNSENKNISDTLQRILSCWTEGGDLRQEFKRRDIRSSYAPMSWYCLFAGHGHYPDVRSSSGNQQNLTGVDMSEVDEFVRRCTMNFRKQNQQLSDLD